MQRTLATHLATKLEAMRNCVESGNEEWQDKHESAIEYLTRNFLPSGGGIDNGTKFDMDKSTGAKLVFHTSYHHMNQAGYYDGWTEHTVTVCAAFNGHDIKISGRDRNEIKDYLAELFLVVLKTEFIESADGTFTPAKI